MVENKYFLDSTNDTTDRTKDIEAKLSEYGVCVLGSGVYYVSGVNMPEGSTLRGMGRCSKLLLAPEVEDGYTVKMASYSTIKDMHIMGSESNIALPEEVGKRHGILYYGTATLEDWMGDVTTLNSIISDCYITSFNGGGLTCIDTGYYMRASIVATNCYILNCGAGINISHYSEYHKFTNMHCCENLYGCINNGGNNVFTACAFDGNGTGFVIDNANDKSPNNSHGSVVGCTFNHTAHNKGIGILLIKANVGYIFSGCQMWYSQIVMEDCENIVFDTFNYGRKQKINVKGGGVALFTNSVFYTEPVVSIENNDNVKFRNCFTKGGEEVKI